MSISDFDPRSYWVRRLDDDWSIHGTGMSATSHSFNRWMYRVRRAVFVRTVRRIAINPEEAHVLDIGPGAGFYVELWQRLGVRQVTGMDIADSAVARLRQKYPDVRFVRMDISDEGAADQPDRFDFISAFDVLLHIVDDDLFERAIKNIYDLLHPGGWFVFSDPFPQHDDYPKREHYSNRRLGFIEEKLQETGFEIVSRRPTIMIMCAPFDMRSRWRRKLWRLLIFSTTRGERLGGIVGAILYPVELTLTRILQEGPSMEIMVCRKPG